VIISLLLWGSILAIEALLCWLAYLMFCQAYQLQIDGTDETNHIYSLYGFSAGLGVLALVWICLVCYLRKDFGLTEKIVVEASKPVTAMPVLLLWPFFQVIGFSLFLAPFCIVAMYAASLGTVVDIVDSNGFHHKNLVFDLQVQAFGVFLVFVLFWTVQYIIAVGRIMLALAVAQWYFVRDKSEIGSGTVCAAIFQSFLFHMGTAALGGLVTDILLFFKAIFSFFHKITLMENGFGRAVHCCCTCCICCFQSCVQYVNKHAYIQTAIFSSGFCESCVASFHLLARNTARLGAITIVMEFILIVMQIFISLLSATLAFRLFEVYECETLSNLLGPTILIFILAWVISTQFKDIFGMAILTVLHCFVADEEINSTTPEKIYAEGELRKFITDVGQGALGIGEERKLLESR